MSWSSFGYALVAGLLPSFIWLWFWLREDANHEPKSLVTATFLGGVLAVLVAILAERYIASLVTDQTILYTIWAAVEELVKFTTVSVIIFSSAKAFREPIDAMIYCIIVALGFAALENALFIMTPIQNGEISKTILTGDMRFIGATLVHVVSSATVGFALGFVYYRSFLVKLLAVSLGLILATTLHAAFNLSIINSSAVDTLRTFAWFWGAVVVLIILFEEIKVVRPKLT